MPQSSSPSSTTRLDRCITCHYVRDINEAGHCADCSRPERWEFRAGNQGSPPASTLYYGIGTYPEVGRGRTVAYIPTDLPDAEEIARLMAVAKEMHTALEAVLHECANGQSLAESVEICGEIARAALAAARGEG